MLKRPTQPVSSLKIGIGRYFVLESSVSPGGSRTNLMGCPMWDISGPILALHFPYLPISAGETSILISAECQKELVGEWEGETERGWKEGVHLIRQLRIREEDLGERGPNVLERGTSSLSNYHLAVLFRADSVSTYGGRPGTTACWRFTSTHILMHKLMQIWLRFKCTSNDAQKRYKYTHKRECAQTHTHTHCWPRAECHNSPMKYIQIREVSHYSPAGW